MRSRDTRPIAWIKAARKAFVSFPKGAQDEILRALTVAAEGQKADIAKPLKGVGAGVFEVALQQHPPTKQPQRASARQARQAAPRLLRFAPALRVTRPARCGLDAIRPEGNLPARQHRPEPS